MNELVSVIIPTLNSAKFLERTLYSVASQTYPLKEVIIVDGGSEDNTLQLAKAWGAKVIQTAKGRSRQKNAGARAAVGKYLYFIDDDFLLENGVIAEAVNLLESGQGEVVEVHNTSDPTVSFWSKVRKFERDMLINDTINVSPRFLTKAVFDKLGGFNEEMIAGEDYDFLNRVRAAGLRMVHTKSIETHLDEPASLGEVIKKHYFYGRTLAVGKTAGEKAKLTFWQRFPIKPAYLRHWYDFLLHPGLSLGLLIYNLCRYNAAAAGFFAGKIFGRTEDKTFKG